jgi:hypothetical protein
MKILNDGIKRGQNYLKSSFFILKEIYNIKYNILYFI